MLPVSEIVSRPRVRGVFSDIDDTLTHDGIVDLAAYSALFRARAAGLRIVLVTGRPAGWAEVLASVWPVDAAIAENGGIAYLKREGRLEKIYFDPGDPAEDLRRLGHLADEVIRTFPFARRSDDCSLRITDLAFDVGEHQRLSPDQIDALTAKCRELGAKTLVSSVHAHAFFHAADKAKMSARVANVLWGETPHDTAEQYAFVGDSPNDQAAFTFFHASIGVANVSRYLAKLNPLPRYITTLPNGRGFAEAIEAILSV
jgi:HAD superfamily hydrolase (TIGR01484 family)